MFQCSCVESKSAKKKSATFNELLEYSTVNRRYSIRFNESWFCCCSESSFLHLSRKVFLVAPSVWFTAQPSSKRMTPTLDMLTDIWHHLIVFVKIYVYNYFTWFHNWFADFVLLLISISVRVCVCVCVRERIYNCCAREKRRPLFYDFAITKKKKKCVVQKCVIMCRHTLKLWLRIDDKIRQQLCGSLFRHGIIRLWKTVSTWSPHSNICKTTARF